MLPRGIRNHNPGNLRRSADKWQGLAPVQSDPEFFVFRDAVYGIRALARTLITYQDRYGLRTIEKIIARWAPPAENDTLSYIASVVKQTRIGARTALDLHSYADLRPLVEAIIRHENGMQPYTAAQIDKGLALAGVEKPHRSLGRSRTVAAGTVATASTGGAGAIEILQTAVTFGFGTAVQTATDALSPLADYLEIAKWALFALTLIGVGVMVYARWDDFRRLAR